MSRAVEQSPAKNSVGPHGRPAVGDIVIERRVMHSVDFAATFVFATEGAISGVLAHLDPIGVLVLAFLTGLGGGLLRDLLLAVGRPIALRETRYTFVVMAAALVSWVSSNVAWVAYSPIVVALDAAGLSLAAVAGTQKALEYRTPRLIAIFIGALSGVGGGLMRDVLLNQVPRVLHTDIYASAAMLAAILIVVCDAVRLNPRVAAPVAGCACFSLRLLAYHQGWALPLHVP